jgi:hypothetical protein
MVYKLDIGALLRRGVVGYFHVGGVMCRSTYLGKGGCGVGRYLWKNVW